MTASLTHAGAVAFRREDGGVRFLVVASSDARNWVLPKGHIEEGEAPEETARRELDEEAGVSGEVVTELTVQEFEKPGETVRVQYFLVRTTAIGPAEEERERAWLSAEDALARLSFADAREALRLATHQLGQ